MLSPFFKNNDKALGDTLDTVPGCNILTPFNVIDIDEFPTTVIVA